MFADEILHEFVLERVDDHLFELSYPRLASQLSRTSRLIFRGSEYERLTGIIRQAVDKFSKGELNYARRQKLERD